LASLVDGGWLARNAVVVVEEQARATIGAPVALRLAEERVYGDTKIAILVKTESDEDCGHNEQGG
jgi:16S rRNA G966 N2-methylase RsmD